MNKDEALKMAIERLEGLSYIEHPSIDLLADEISITINACKEALEQNDNLLTIAYMSGVAEGKSKALEALKMAGYELDGVIADVEKFDGFDDVCLQTIKRVKSTIEEALATNEESSVVQLAQEKTLKSLRDEFAMAALSGAYAAQGGSGGWIQHDEKESLLILAKNFYKTADAMIKARELKDE
jgi:hypothetical protein